MEYNIQKQKLMYTLFICLIILSGCSWPQYGAGGTDEIFSYSRYSSVNTIQTLSNARIKKIATDLDLFRGEIDYAWLGTAGKHKPAKLTLIDMQWNRAAREFAGGLYVDAETNLQLLKQIWREMRQELNLQLLKYPI